jgi:hypothetical protein
MFKKKEFKNKNIYLTDSVLFYAYFVLSQQQHVVDLKKFNTKKCH